ncbi:alanyl-tRNA synthetase domain-containing protein [Fomitiporia mediterranea MF3/22]|uniref:alanyl-tRNA synthetase domain-containing protein n=1 Tax=Fomitiporia mediterranea (strain MF3/22) TaxID=694068 RepID=UPI0004409554|nr:alanyl-tRNA synthetase domain-containing protein [Fomitiporia mediterranea MF3/22]EJD01246.1 alanyl-tRNA synthetase domain-containing protein [Fomitiporia mediterranea MF3/22]
MAAAALVLPAVPITPPDYHRIVSDRLKIPDDRTLPIPVGLLACQRDPLLKELLSTVVSCNVHQPEQSQTNNKKKSSAPAEKLFEVILHDTVLFPVGGGQPSDIGILRTANGDEYEVVEVLRRGGHAVHFVKPKDGQVPGLEVGAQVTAALGEAGFSRRLDHMCMHTSQHLLSALLESELKLPTLSWALTSYPTPSYVELQRPLTLEEVARIQARAHALAYEGRKVHVEVEPLDSENHPGVVTLKSGRSVGKALPSDYTGGVKRTIIIDGVDRNPCCGTHLPSLHNLQLFLLPQTESLARGSTSTSRLFFLCGPRLHEHLATTHALLTETAGIMSCGIPLVPARVSQVIEERRRVDRRAEELEFELARVVADGLLKEMQTSEATHFVKHYHRTDDPARALGFLQSIATSFIAGASNTSDSNPSSRSYTIVSTSTPAEKRSTNVCTVLVLGSDDACTKTAGDALKAQLGVKGGGRGVRWSGKWTGVWRETKEGATVEEILKGIQN